MTTQQAIAAVFLLVKEKKIRKQSLAYKSIMEAIKFPGQPSSCGTNIGSGRFSSSKSWLGEVVRVLKLADIPFTTGNNAPKGEKNGDYVLISLTNSDAVEISLNLISKSGLTKRV